MLPRRSIKQHRQKGISLSRDVIKEKSSKKINKNMNQSFSCHQSYLNAQNNPLYQSIDDWQNRESVKNKYYLKSNLNSQKKSNFKRSPLKQSKRNYENQQSNLWQQAESINQMIQLLVQYQKLCQGKMDLVSAEEARKKINQLKKQQLTNRRKQIQFQSKSEVQKTERESQNEMEDFQNFWHGKIQEAIKALKQIQESHISEQQKQFKMYQQAVWNEENPKIKYSSKVLEIRRNLTSLIKSREYKEAQHLKSILEKLQIEQQEKWEITCVQKKKYKVKDFKRKQQTELDALRIKLTSSFNQLMKQKEKQQQRMGKKMKKKRIQSFKTPSSRLRAKTNLLNESKARIHPDNF